MANTPKASIKGYQPLDGAQSPGRRIAHFLDWAARKHPRELFPKTIVAQAISRLSSRVRSTSPLVKNVANAMNTARKVLLDEYKRDLVTERGVGSRATVDDQDALLNPYKVRVERVDSAVRQLQMSAGNINISKVPTNDQTRALKGSFSEVSAASLSLSEKTKRLREQLALPANGSKT